MPFDSPAARELNIQIFETIYHAALEASCEMAQEKGPDTVLGDLLSERSPVPKVSGDSSPKIKLELALRDRGAPGCPHAYRLDLADSRMERVVSWARWLRLSSR
jgi:hypothetical protein